MTTAPVHHSSSPAASPDIPSSASTTALGRLGEDIVADLLADAGWVILERNFRAGRGEIDIIALDGRTLVLVEVKTRRTLAAGTPFEAIDARKLSRIRRAFGHYLLHHSPPHVDVRIDAISVHLPRTGESRIEHLRGVAA